MEEIYKLKLGECFIVDEFLDILRVPGGWIYAFREIVDGKETELQKSEILISLEEAEKKHIVNVMGFLNNNVRKASSILGVSERTLQRKLKKIREE